MLPGISGSSKHFSDRSALPEVLVFTDLDTPAGTRVQETLKLQRKGTTTGQTRTNARTSQIQQLVDFDDGDTAWATFLVILP